MKCKFGLELVLIAAAEMAACIDYAHHSSEFSSITQSTYRYCPGGHGKLLDGVQDQTESWAAVIDDVNDWVQVDATGECTLYSETGKFIFPDARGFCHISIFPVLVQSDVFNFGNCSKGTSKLGNVWRG